MKKKIAAILLLLSVPVLMAATGVGPSAWTKFTQAIADGDFIAMTDISDTTQSSSGTSKAATALQMKTYVMGGALPTADNQILQATGVGTYSWTSTLEGIIDDTKGNGDTTYLWSADKVYDQLALKLNATALDDTKGNGDTTYIWSADKVYDELALKQTAIATEVDGSAAANLTAAQVSGTVISNYGQGAGDVALTLPTAAAGYNALFVVGTAQSNKWGVRANTNDKIYLLAADGTVAAGSDNGYARMTAAVVGQSFACWTFKTGSSAWDWMCKAGSVAGSTFAAN